MNIDIVERAPTRVAYLRYTGPFGEPLGRFWRGTVAPWLADQGLLDCPRYGVPLDDVRNTPAERCRYDACVEMPPGLTLPDVAETTIAGGRYAVTNFKGTGAEVGPAWGAFYVAHGQRGSDWDHTRLPFEHYPRGATFDHRTGTFVCKLCIPVRS